MRLITSLEMPSVKIGFIERVKYPIATLSLRSRCVFDVPLVSKSKALLCKKSSKSRFLLQEKVCIVGKGFSKSERGTKESVLRNASKLSMFDRRVPLFHFLLRYT